MPEGVAADLLRTAMRQFPTGVTVVTCVADGVDHAMTASAFTSVSLDPPLVLLCVRRTARFAEALRATAFWGVSVLDDGGEAAARWFAQSGRPLPGQLDQFPHIRGGSGVPLLAESLARLECRTTEVVPGGDHDIVVGAVQAVDVAPGRMPLVHWDGDYPDLHRKSIR